MFCKGKLFHDWQDWGSWTAQGGGSYRKGKYQSLRCRICGEIIYKLRSPKWWAKRESDMQIVTKAHCIHCGYEKNIRRDEVSDYRKGKCPRCGKGNHPWAEAKEEHKYVWIHKPDSDNPVRVQFGKVS